MAADGRANLAKWRSSRYDATVAKNTHRAENCRKKRTTAIEIHDIYKKLNLLSSHSSESESITGQTVVVQNSSFLNFLVEA